MKFSPGRAFCCLAGINEQYVKKTNLFFLVLYNEYLILFCEYVKIEAIG